MMADDLAEEPGTQETCALEFKIRIRDQNVVRKAICAMANDLAGKGGGDILTDIQNEGKILDRPSVFVEQALFDGQSIIRIRVEASASPPVRLDGVTWVRPGPTTRRASSEDERVLIERRRAKSQPFDTHPVPCSGIAELDVRLFRRTYLPSSAADTVIEENHRPEAQQLASLRLLDARTETATVLGLLLLGFDPSGFLPGACTQFVRYESTEVDSAVVDEQEIRANVVDTLAQLLVQVRVGPEEVLGDRELGHGSFSGAGGRGSSGGDPVADTIDNRGLARPALAGRSTARMRGWPVPATGGRKAAHTFCPAPIPKP
ncbi:AlbA family DNA-binding domain-containing protein [Nocardiopsis xinjiangensis]|uniref:AlbA family DNA-binding domain-containing protein n=1 Tax=Nocardiopsis xinjiangensis TaxID=124285 RepID=UPI00126968F9|nr:hypothetical protein [Nocardiopsis xinjiangensis]